mmetsp:Transcript_636/g.2008  ORF Transcript_636/g.2008 Transcript_636/m.2008 type:complete len:269 (+) Transcript_636:69-875(+)
MAANGNKPHPGGHVRPASKADVGNYTPTNILVTGGAGFIASHVVIGLVEKYPQYKVVCLDKMDYCSSLHNLDKVKDKPNFKMVKGNLLSADLMNYVLETEQIDTIIHAAAQTHVDNSFGNSFAFTENNVLGTHVLVEAAKKAGIRRFIHVSTDEVYGSSYSEEPSRKEGDVLEPTNPYAATKAAAENIARSYWRTPPRHRASRPPRAAPSATAPAASLPHASGPPNARTYRCLLTPRPPSSPRGTRSRCQSSSRAATMSLARTSTPKR